MNSLPEEPDNLCWSDELQEVLPLSERSDLGQPLRTEPKRLGQEGGGRGLQNLRGVPRSRARLHRGRL